MASAAGEGALVPGVLLDGRYVIQREVGRGAMGRVFAARDTKLEREVAIKVVSPGAHDAADLARITREARTIGALAHTNIVAIYDVGSFGGGPYLVEELVRGETLRDQLRGRPLPTDRALGLGVQLARGLAAAHEQGIVHRDIKPENLFVTPEGSLKILDFGIATLQAAPDGLRTWTGPSPKSTQAGTPEYMSPEQIEGRAVDHRSDLFSVGTVLHEMLLGRRTFERNSTVETAWAILNDPPAALPKGVPRPLQRMVMRCLEKARESRPQSARDLAFDLEVMQTPARSARSRRLMIVLGAGLAATLALAAALSSRRAGPQAEFRQITFHRGAVWSARLAPDGKTVFYAVSVDASGPQLHSTTLARPAVRRLEGAPANLLAVSSSGELAILLRPEVARYGYDRGVLARFLPGVSAPRELVENVEAADWTPDGSALAIVRKVESGTQLEFPVNQVLYQSSGWISHPRFSPDGRRIAFVSHPTPSSDAGVVMVSDLAGSVRPLTPPWRNVLGLAWAKGGAEVWFTAANAASPLMALRAVSATGLSEGRVLARVGGDLRLQDVAPDGRALLTQPDQRLGLAIVRSEDAKPQDFSWFDRTFLGDLSADGRLVLFSVDGPAAGQNPLVYLRKLDGSPPIRLGEGYAAALSPDGRWAMSFPPMSNPAQTFTLLPTGPGESRTVDVAGVSAVRVRWFADGERILVSGTEQGHGMRLYVRRLDGDKARPISPEGVGITGLAVSRDGAYAAASDGQGRTTLYPVEGGNAVPLPELDRDQVPLGFAEDGSLFVGRLTSSTVPVYRFDVRRRQKALVTTLTTDARAPILRVVATPDGSTFAFNYATVAANLYQLNDAE